MMMPLSIQVTYRKGRPFAAYICLPRVCLMIQGRFAEAEQQLDIARNGDPLAPGISNLAGRIYVAWRKPDQALLQHLAYAYAVTGQPEQATHILESVLASPDPDRLAFHIALTYSGLGNRDPAFAWLERGIEQAGSFVGVRSWSPDSSHYTRTHAGGVC